MIEEIVKNVYRITVALEGNPLRSLNCYFIRGEERELLIDTGFRSAACHELLTKALSELCSRPERRDILLTHMHSDHSGLANDFVGEGRHIYMSRRDTQYLRGVLEGNYLEQRLNRFVSEGFPREMREAILTQNPTEMKELEFIGNNFRELDDGDILQVGDYTLQTILVPGHTPGSCMFWLKEQELMFTGDHVLFDISPNITCWTDTEDTLGDYLEHLKRAGKYRVRLALPGHRETGRYQERIDTLIEHHQERLDEIVEIVKAVPGLTAYDIAGQMKWRIRSRSWDTFPVVQKWFAVGECIAHMDYLTKRELITKMLAGETWSYYLPES